MLCFASARQSRNQKIFTEDNEGNEEEEKLSRKCRVFGNSSAKEGILAPYFMVTAQAAKQKLS
jgi:hypothetical protein